METSKIKLSPVKSSNIAQLGYDKESSIMVIEFNSGAKYAYKDVPQTLFEELLNAPSIGSFFHQNIKPIYPYERI